MASLPNKEVCSNTPAQSCPSGDQNVCINKRYTTLNLIIPLWRYIFFNILFLSYYSCPHFPSWPLLPSLPPTPTVNPHTLVPVHGSCIHVLWLIPLPSLNQSPPHLLQLSVCSMVLCLWFYFAHSLFCTLDFTYKWDHVVSVFHWLAYFT